jgi:hypothetical protein
MSTESQQQQQPASEGAAPDAGEVRLSRAEYDNLMASRAEAEQARYRAAEDTLTVDDRVQRIEERYRRSATTGAVAEAFGGMAFASDAAAADARALLLSEIEMRADDAGELVAFHRPSNRPLRDVGRRTIEERFAHLIAPTSRGGSGAASYAPAAGGGGGAGGTVGDRMLDMARRGEIGPPRGGRNSFARPNG